MNGERATALVLAVLAVLALGAAAATLDSAASGALGGGGGGTLDPPESDGPTLEPLSLFLQALLVAVLVGAVAALAILAYREGLGALTQFGLMILAVAFALLVVSYLLSVGDFLPGGANVTNASGPVGVGDDDGGGLLPGGGDGTVPSVAVRPDAALLALLCLTLVGVVAVVVRATGDGDAPKSVEEGTPPPEPDVRAVGAAAGRAADRIAADADASNAVYRAWREMTDHLDVADPETSTPGEFADAAVAAGMAREDVAELTTLFEVTRYGGAEVDATREERALAALRRIEREYAGAEGR
ncbi:DUF4129 domain-containing protein [Halomarina ordinaria]|uniref:DUF4129 domain-containing protein n=1 Tax=Halomarina ordinaria TaxID=3033939 RepID=A0ABD5U8Q4_9EURY|nr:DUF4129 domain-containing protein [Halomarina sp. PSRA2]